MNPPFDLTKEEMKAYGYKIIDILAEHFDNLESKKPVSSGTREEMDAVFLQEAPNEATPADEVLDFVMNNVIPHSNLQTHPKSYSFVPGPSNYISTLADTLANGFNIFSGGWIVSPAAAELEIVTMNWLLKMFDFPVQQGGGIFTSAYNALAEGVSEIFGYLMNPALQGEAARLAALRASRVVPNAGFQAAVSIGVQRTMNPNTRALFKGVNLREFSFNFKMIANSQREAIAIERIVNHFRTELYPNVISALNVPIAYEMPNAFSIQFTHHNA